MCVLEIKQLTEVREVKRSWKNDRNFHHFSRMFHIIELVLSLRVCWSDLSSVYSVRNESLHRLKNFCCMTLMNVKIKIKPTNVLNHK